MKSYIERVLRVYAIVGGTEAMAEAAIPTEEFED
jgi:hypothetical protein